ncbi:MAG: CBS domain-containing protein [Bdellovibrionales bacterium]
MRIMDCMTKEVELATPQMTLVDAAKKMLEGDFGFLPIAQNDRLIGVVTDRDIVVRGIAKGLDPKISNVREIITDEVLYCFEDQTVEEVAHNMGENQVRRLPVMNREKKLVGVVSLGDLARSANSAKDQVEDALFQISKPGYVQQVNRTLL